MPPPQAHTGSRIVRTGPMDPTGTPMPATRLFTGSLSLIFPAIHAIGR